ncbi:TIGR03667 family PPOX class F420-dependent oxidoreductase [Chloroflexota bacterium]
MTAKQIHFQGELGERVQQRLENELVVWLTTVSADGTPQPNPVWFLWDGETCLVFSKPNNAKVHNIIRHPQVSLHFEGAGVVSGDVTILTGNAWVELDSGPIPQEYKKKYKEALKEFGYTWDQMQAEYSAAIFINLKRYRGF